LHVRLLFVAAVVHAVVSGERFLLFDACVRISNRLVDFYWSLGRL
jgi:hypothetical protein